MKLWKPNIFFKGKYHSNIKLKIRLMYKNVYHTTPVIIQLRSIGAHDKRKL